MKEKEILLGSIDKVKEFVDMANEVQGDILVRNVNGRYVVDGKSIMGLFSIDIANTIIVEYPEDDNAFDKYLETLKKRD